MKTNYDTEPEMPRVYAVKHKMSSVREASRSGGIFTALSDEILDRGGIIYGCVLEKDFSAVHKRALSRGERDLMRGSKYIQSDISGVYSQIKDDLISGFWVLFSGTPCQVAAIRKYLLNIDQSKLILVDIICHGVPSFRVWKDYIRWQSKRNHGICTSVNFRNKKKYGWQDHVETLVINNKEVDSRIFRNLYFEHSILRPACHCCSYAKIRRPGDITIGDFWGIDQAAPGFNDNMGVSLVLINNKKGYSFFNSIREAVDYLACDLKDCLQTSLIHPAQRSETRDRFWNNYEQHNFSYIVFKYGRTKLYERIRNKLKK